MRSRCRRGSGVNSSDEQNTSAAFTRVLSLSLSLIADMNPKKPDLESHAEALLKRIQRHNLGLDSLTALEVRRLLEEIQVVGKLNLADSLPEDVLARVDRIMRQAVQEARSIVEGASGHGTKNRTD